MAVAAQALGCALLCVAVAMLAGLWWGVMVAGLLLAAGGVLAEAAQRPTEPPDDDVTAF